MTISFVSCGDANKETDLEKGKLNGDVFMVSSRIYDASEKFGDVVKSSPLKNTGDKNSDTYFNKSGYEIRQDLFDEEHLRYYTYLYELDEDNS